MARKIAHLLHRYPIVMAALLASFTSVATKAAGGTRTYRGILSKPGRMALLTVFSIAVLLIGPDAWWPFGPLLVIGAHGVPTRGAALRAARAHGLCRVAMGHAQ